jgi:hypothetical protein
VASQALHVANQLPVLIDVNGEILEANWNGSIGRGEQDQSLIDRSDASF